MVSWLPTVWVLVVCAVSLLLRAPLVAVGLAFGGIRLLSAPLEPPPDDLVALAGQTVEIRGSIVGFPEQRDGYQQFVMEGRSGVFHGKTLVRTDPLLAATPGDEVTLSGSLKAPEPSPDFDYRSYLAKDGIHSLTSYAEVSVIGRERTLTRLFWSLRRTWVSQLERQFPEPTAGFLLGILIGERSSLSDGLIEAFRRTGTTHILALSGFNVSIIVAGIIAVLGRRPPAVIVALAFIAGFVFLVGPAASIIRAALMGGFLLLGQLLGRPQLATYAAIITAAGMLAINPHALRYDLGFDLSFLATLGILQLEPGLNDRLPRLPDGIRGIVAATLAAGLVTAPVIAASFGSVSLVAPIANLVVVPMIPWLMLGGFVSTVLSFVGEPVAALPALLTAWGTVLVLEAVTALAEMPLAAVSVEAAKGPVAAGLAVICGIVAFRLRRPAHA